jgi:hypothetical protein
MNTSCLLAAESFLERGNTAHLLVVRHEAAVHAARLLLRDQIPL